MATEAGEGTAVPSPDDELHQQFQQQHPGMTEAHPLYAELFDDWRTEIGGAA